MDHYLTLKLNCHNCCKDFMRYLINKMPDSIIKFFLQIKSDENSIGERVIIYHLLSSVGNLDSQQV